MKLTAQYDCMIFDCDGVIFDSNRPKIAAMRSVLEECGYSPTQVSNCIDFFQNNFGTPRQVQIDNFFDRFIDEMPQHENQRKTEVFEKYSAACQGIFEQAELSPGILDLLNTFSGDKFVASGSVQTELREIISACNLDHYFKGVYGSPTAKAEIVASILRGTPYQKSVLIGDARADYEAATANSIDFIYFKPFSMVQESMIQLAEQEKFQVIDDFRALLD
ncbi:HAD family hydrolase [Teredinibacter turnerae]|uniref:HAD family hydrolase n=1 Tax=Teredinibacter turnerae TaxID=2426 RepID=UPI0030CC0E12